MTNAATGVTTTYGYDPEGNRLTAVGGAAVTYDGDGQMTAYGSDAYAWNTENQLASVTTASGTDTYTYDPLGRRATIDGYHIGYVGNSDVVAYATDSGNNLVKRFTYDAWGNIIGKTDSTGAMDVSEINPFVYKGYWYDWDTGLYYLNARYYSPGIGRFLSEDPAAATPGNALSYNEYAYAGNDPVNRVDPSGEIWWRAVFRWVGDLLAQAPPEIPALEILEEMGFGLKGLSEIGETAAEGTGDVAKQGLNFTKTTAKWMDNPGRAIPVQTLKQAIDHGVEGPDPQGTNAVMYYTRMYRNGSEYNLEVLYDKATNTILHFEYARKAMGPLSALTK